MTRAALLRGVDIGLHRAGERAYPRAPSVEPEMCAEFRVLLATDPVTARGDAERALAQLARVGQVRVDVVHVVKPGTLTRETWQRVHDTLAGATTRGAVGHFLVEDGDPAAAIARFCSHGDYDLIMAPASAGGTWWLPWRRSVRAAIVRRSPVPVWTTGARPPEALARHQVRDVGCYVSLETGADAHLGWAADFTTRLGARLHLMHVVPPVDDSTIAEAFTSDRPLHLEAAHERLRALLAGGLQATTTAVVGTRHREVGRLVRAQAIDLLCVSRSDALYGPQLSPALRALACPVVCCP